MSPRPHLVGLRPWAERPAPLLGLLALWLLATAGVRPLLLPDEGRYAGVAFEMLQGDALVPTLHGLPFFHKPPLMYWVDMAGMALFGVNAFAARLAPALGAWLMGAALYLHLRAHAGARAAAVALGVLATTPFFYIGGQYANHDMLVAGWVSVAILCAVQAVGVGAVPAGGAGPIGPIGPIGPTGAGGAGDSGQPTGAAGGMFAGPGLRWVVGAWAAAALAVLSKGLIGVVLPALVLLPWLLAQRRARAVLRLLHPAGLAVFVLLVAPWFAAMQLRYPAFLDYFVLEQHVRRYAQGGFNNVQPFWFYFAVLPLLMLPWSPWLVAAWRRRARPPLATAPLGLHAWWALAVLAFFSLPQSKLVGYALPALAPAAALAGLAVVQGRAWRGLMPVAALGCVALVLGLAQRAPGSHRDVARVLGTQWVAGDRVAYIDEAFFDVRFYARLPMPPIVLADWDNPRLRERDDWRKELLDAARFDPAGARARLLPLPRAGELLCAPGTVWVLSAPDWQPPPALQALASVTRGAHAQLWRGRGGVPAACP